jgi:hypothetical protein
MQHDALQELESPPIVRLARHEPLLHDAQHRRVLVRLDHRRGVARKEGAQQRDESWDGALLSPDGRRDEEREEGAVLDWYAHVQRQHLGEDLEDIGYVFCDKSISGWPEKNYWSHARSMSFCKISVNEGKERGFENRDRVWHSSADKSNKTGYAFENVLIEVGVTRVWGDFAEDVDEPLQNCDVLSDERLLRRDDNSRNTWERDCQAPTCRV